MSRGISWQHPSISIEDRGKIISSNRTRGSKKGWDGSPLPTDRDRLLSVCHNNFKTDFGSRTNLSPPMHPRLERRRLAVKNQFPGALGGRIQRCRDGICLSQSTLKKNPMTHEVMTFQKNHKSKNQVSQSIMNYPVESLPGPSMHAAILNISPLHLRPA